jgi:hypothetical protein
MGTIDRRWHTDASWPASTASTWSSSVSADAAPRSSAPGSASPRPAQRHAIGLCGVVGAVPGKSRGRRRAAYEHHRGRPPGRREGGTGRVTEASARGRHPDVRHEGGPGQAARGVAPPHARSPSAQAGRRCAAPGRFSPIQAQPPSRQVTPAIPLP